MKNTVGKTVNQVDQSPLITVLVILFAIVGGALVILSALIDGIDPSLRLSFKGYLSALSLPLVALGVAKAGRFIGRS
jgi:hypothetical protein